MAAFITPAAAQFALEHQKSWSSEHHPEDPHYFHHHHRHRGEIHSYLQHKHKHRRSHSDHGLHDIEHSHHLGDSLRCLFRGQGHLHQRSHSDYLLHGEKHGHHHKGHPQDDHNYSPSVKRHISNKMSANRVGEGESHSHRDKFSGQDQHGHHHDHHHETGFSERQDNSHGKHKGHGRYYEYEVGQKV